jgi:hypothetical protein
MSSGRDLTCAIGDLVLWIPAGIRQDRRTDCRPEGFLNALRITVTGGRFLTNDIHSSCHSKLQKSRNPRPCLPAVAERRREPGSQISDTRLRYFAILCLLETPWASEAFLSMYFLLLVQKKVPKKKTATAKRPYARHARTPRKIMFQGIISWMGLAVAVPARHPQGCSAAALPLHHQPHLSLYCLINTEVMNPVGHLLKVEARLRVTSE